MQHKKWLLKYNVFLHPSLSVHYKSASQSLSTLMQIIPPFASDNYCIMNLLLPVHIDLNLPYSFVTMYLLLNEQCCDFSVVQKPYCEYSFKFVNKHS